MAAATRREIWPEQNSSLKENTHFESQGAPFEFDIIVAKAPF
jgi:hypothetical protein